MKCKSAKLQAAKVQYSTVVTWFMSIKLQTLGLSQIDMNAVLICRCWTWAALVLAETSPVLDSTRGGGHDANLLHHWMQKLYLPLHSHRMEVNGIWIFATVNFSCVWLFVPFATPTSQVQPGSLTPTLAPARREQQSSTGHQMGGLPRKLDLLTWLHK